MESLDSQLLCVSESWTPQQRLHVGNVAWAFARGDGSTHPDRLFAWGDPLVGFANAWLDGDAADVSLHLASSATPSLRDRALRVVAALAPTVTLDVSRQDGFVVNVLTEMGFCEEGDRPWFVQLWRDLVDLADIDRIAAIPGYRVRATRSCELAERVDLHRRCWAPSRIKSLLGLPVSGDEPDSSYSLDKHLDVMSTPVYRPELDLVVEARDGTLAAYGIGWLDPENRAVLFEPIGTDPDHSGLGLARAVCAEILRTARSLGATQAVVGPRGDDAYLLPRRVYEGLGMREVAQFVTLTRSL